MITLVIADDQMMIREGLKTIINLEDDMQVVGMASNGEEACLLANQYKPTLMLMDIQMPIMDGITALTKIKQQFPHMYILILTTFLDDQYIINGMTNGASGYLLKDMDTDKMLESIRNTVDGQFILPAAVASRLVERLVQTQPKDVDRIKVQLTERELEIAELMIKGYNNKEIASLLYIATGTVRNYVSTLYSKLGVIDRVQAIVKLQGVV